MKKIATGFLFMILLSCSNKGKKVSPTNEGTPNTPNVENVNGNIPDTVNTVTLGHPDTTKDSSGLKDSTKK